MVSILPWYSEKILAYEIQTQQHALQLSSLMINADR